MTTTNSELTITKLMGNSPSGIVNLTSGNGRQCPSANSSSLYIIQGAGFSHVLQIDYSDKYMCLESVYKMHI